LGWEHAVLPLRFCRWGGRCRGGRFWEQRGSRWRSRRRGGWAFRWCEPSTKRTFEGLFLPQLFGGRRIRAESRASGGSIIAAAARTPGCRWRGCSVCGEGSWDGGRVLAGGGQPEACSSDRESAVEIREASLRFSLRDGAANFCGSRHFSPGPCALRRGVQRQAVLRASSQPGCAHASRCEQVPHPPTCALLQALHPGTASGTQWRSEPYLLVSVRLHICSVDPRDFFTGFRHDSGGVIPWAGSSPDFESDI
jgi:hypothetical protein